MARRAAAHAQGNGTADGQAETRLFLSFYPPLKSQIRGFSERSSGAHRYDQPRSHTGAVKCRQRDRALLWLRVCAGDEQCFSPFLAALLLHFPGLLCDIQRSEQRGVCLLTSRTLWGRDLQLWG